jgi:serpin B
MELTGNETVMVADGKNFSMKFFETVYKRDKQTENIILSPFSMNMALGVLRNGAEGETKQAMQEVMGMRDFADSEINAFFKKLNDQLKATDPSLELAIANSIWHNKDLLTIKPDFTNLSKTWFDAPITGLDYSAMDKAVKTVNRWCEDHTNGLIKDMLKSLASIEILNALYFKGNWSEDYEFEASRTEKQDFTKENGNKIRADLMHNELDLTYYEDDFLAMTNIPYGNRSYSMYFVLPKEDITFDDMVEQLAEPGYWAQCLANTHPGRVDLYIPKFKLEYENKYMREILIEMGMGVACHSETAEFPHISGSGRFSITRAMQKTFIRVDEKGTEAAAVTEIGLDGAHFEEEKPFHRFRADRTFLFVIQENSTGTILFMGKIGDPATG